MQYEDYILDVLAVAKGDKPCMIASYGKLNFDQFHALRAMTRSFVGGPGLYEFTGVNEKDSGLRTVIVTAVCEDGHEYDQILFGRYYDLLALTSVLDTVRTADRHDPLYDRERVQRAMGSLLGYDDLAVERFVHSDVAAKCPCDWCGGPGTVQRTDHDDAIMHARRTMYHA